ncbi:MAG: hypothetical protein EHM20_09200, partial [Alphaproteobacteria bacterium]
MREEIRPNDPRKIGVFTAENKKWSGSLTEAIKVLAALVFVFAMATVVLFILVPEIGLLMGNVLVTVFPAMIIAISVLAFIFFAIYLYESRLRVRYEVKLRKINDDLQKLSSPLRIAIITVLSLIFLAMINLFWASVRVVVNIAGNKPPEIVPLFSQEFVGILPFINLFIISTIIANLLYLVIKSKWVPMTIETVLSIASAVLIYAVILFFPFNPALNSSTLLAIKLGLGFVLVMT